MHHFPRGPKQRQQSRLSVSNLLQTEITKNNKNHEVNFSYNKRWWYDLYIYWLLGISILISFTRFVFTNALWRPHEGLMGAYGNGTKLIKIDNRQINKNNTIHNCHYEMIISKQSNVSIQAKATPVGKLQGLQWQWHWADTNRQSSNQQEWHNSQLPFWTDNIKTI